MFQNRIRYGTPCCAWRKVMHGGRSERGPCTQRSAVAVGAKKQTCGSCSGACFLQGALMERVDSVRRDKHARHAVELHLRDELLRRAGVADAVALHIVVHEPHLSGYKHEFKRHTHCLKGTTCWVQVGMHTQARCEAVQRCSLHGSRSRTHQDAIIIKERCNLSHAPQNQLQHARALGQCVCLSALA